MERSNPNRIKLIFLVAAISLLALSLLSYFRINNLISSATWVAHTKDVELELEKTLAEINEIEYNQRAYFITRLPIFRNPVIQADSSLQSHFDKIDILTRDNPAQQVSGQTLRSVIFKRLDYLKTRMLDTIYDNPSTTIETSALIHQVNKQIRKMQTAEKQLLNTRSALYVKQTYLTPLYTIFLSIAAIILLLVSYFKINQEFKTATILQSNIKQAKDELQTAHELLVQKNQELIKMNKELESFNYISSHDLQEPLRQIQMFASRIEAGEKQNMSDQGKNYFEKMQSKANRMQSLIADLLAYSRTHSAEKNFELTSLNSVIDDVLDELKETIDQKQATIEVEPLGVVKVIPFQFHQMMHNLIGNSLKFSQPGISPHIQIKGHPTPIVEETNSPLIAGKNYIHISVSDNGIGFDPQYKDKIFEVFQRLHDKEKITGTGIGLAIVKKIIENHNGVITSHGAINQGATFNVFLPLEA